jgi:undecaprenyl-diphosphatase
LGGRAPLLAAAASSLVAFVALAAAFWIGTNTNGGHASEPGWAAAVGEAGSWKALPLLVLAIGAVLLVRGHVAETRFLLVAVLGAGVLMYAARITLQALGADDDGGRLSDFPSGHTAAATAFLGAVMVLVWNAWRDTRVRALAAGGAVAGVVVMGWARVASGGHTALDVAGGVALGIGWLAVCLLVLPPDETRPLNRRHVLWALLAVGLCGFVFLAVMYDHEPLTTLDQDIAERVAESTPAWLESLARPFSWLGGWIGLIALGVAASVVLVLERAWRDLAFFLTAFLGSQLVVAVLKDGFDRPRPHAGSAVALPDSAAFPSGHATAGVASLGAVAVLAAERLPSQRARALLWSTFVVLGAAVGVSRIVLNVHFVTDVLAGWSLGLAWLAACLLVRDAAR